MFQVSQLTHCLSSGTVSKLPFNVLFQGHKHQFVCLCNSVFAYGKRGGAKQMSKGVCEALRMVGLNRGVAILEKSLEVPQKIKHKITV